MQWFGHSMNSFSEAYGRLLVRGARASIDEVLAVKKGERVIIITNPQREVRVISMSLYDAAIRKGANVTLLFQNARGRFDFAEEAVIKAMSTEPDVIIS